MDSSSPFTSFIHSPIPTDFASTTQLGETSSTTYLNTPPSPTIVENEDDTFQESNMDDQLEQGDDINNHTITPKPNANIQNISNTKNFLHHLSHKSR